MLFVINMFINYFLLLSVAHIMRIRPSRWRLLAAAALGGLYSMMIFLTALTAIYSLISKLILSVSIVLCAYKRANIKLFLQLLGCFYVVSFAYAGIMMAIWIMFKPSNMIINNSVVYFNISMTWLAISTIISYLIIKIISKLLKRNAPDNSMYTIKIEVDKKQVEIVGFLDTGNALSDAFTDTPVIVTEYKLVEELIPDEVKPYFSKAPDVNESMGSHIWMNRLRLVPYESVGNGGLMPAFRPDKVHIRSLQKTETIKDVLIAVCSNRLPTEEYGALLNPRLIGAAK